MRNVAIIIPAYNEVKTIHDIARRALSQCDRVIIVDDGSTDATLDKISNLSVDLIRHPVNQGKAASLQDGIRFAIEAGAELLVTLDADGQHRPEDIPRLVEQAIAHPDYIIIGSRLADKSSFPAKRYYANKFANFWIAWAAGYPIEDSQSGFRVYPAKLFNTLSLDTRPSNGFVFESEILIKAAQLGILSQAVSIAAIYNDDARPSHFRGVRDILMITRMVAGQLIRRGLYLPGLYRSAIKPVLPTQHFVQTGWDGYLLLLLSICIILLTAGTSLLLILWFVVYTARRAVTTLPTGSLLLIPGMRLHDDMITPPYQQRLKRAQQALEESADSTTIILGGVTHNAGISESQAGKNWLCQQGIDAARIRIEESSRNTLENLREAKAFAQQESTTITLVSQRFHLARCHAIASGFAISHVLCAAEDQFSFTPVSLLRCLTEAFHLHWYYTVKWFARLTKNRRLLSRIS